MGKKTCCDCGCKLTGHGKPLRCQSCAVRARYVAKHGKPPEIFVGNCAACGKRFRDYASNRRRGKGRERFCSQACRAAWTGVKNSIRRGGDGRKRTKKEKDALYYLKTSEQTRIKVKARYAQNREAILDRLKARTRATKEEVIRAYGGRCACCGESHIEFLTIDHVKGDGAEHRQRCGKGRGIYADLKKRGFPQDGSYQVLCLNCNISLGFYGYCPHQKAKQRKVDKTPGKRTGRRGRPRSVK